MTFARPVTARAAGAAGFLLALTLASSLYVVGQNRQAVVLRLGEPVRVVNAWGQDAPGLYLKWPFVDRVARMDKRSQTLEGAPLEITTRDGATLVVDPVLSYRVADPIKAYRAADGAPSADSALQRVLTDSLRETLARVPAAEIIQPPPEPRTESPSRSPLTSEMAADLRTRARAAGLGVDIQSVSLRRVDQGPAEAQATLQRMQAVQQNRAAEMHASGDEQKHQIMADADRQAVVLRASAQAQALRIRGEGDARRMEILGAAYGADPEFARYFRNLEAYENAFENTGTVLVLSPDTAFMRDFKQGPAGK